MPFERGAVQGLDVGLDGGVGVEVGQGHEVVLGQPVGNERREGVAVAVGEGAVGDHVDGLLQARVGLVVGGRTVALGVELLHLVHGHAEEEEVLGADAFADLHVRAVERADGQRAVEGELHVAGAGGLLAGLRDLLVQVGGRDQVLGQAHVVVPREEHVELALDVRIVVDHAGHVVDQLDRQLGHVVARGGLGAEDHGARHDIVGGHVAVLDVRVAGDQGQDLQALTLVLVQTLDHGVEHGVRVHVEAVLTLGVVGEAHLVGMLDLGELLDELVILRQRFEALEQLQVAQPLVGAQAFGDQVGQARVGQLDEAAGGHAVGHVRELLAVQVGEVLERDVLEQLRVQLGHAVDVRAAGHGQVGHAHLRVVTLGDDAHALDLGLVAGLAGDLVQEVVVDLVDDLQMTRQQLADQVGRPHLKRLRQQRVAGVVERTGGDVPRGIPVVAVLVDQHAHELGDADDRVRVVELEGDLVREGGQVRLVLARVEHADRVVDGRGHEEVLLLQAQTLALRRGILRVQDLGDVLGVDLRADGVEIVGTVEGEQVELVVALGGPQAQRVHAARGVARHHVVDRHGAHAGGRVPHALAVLVGHVAAEVHALRTVVVHMAPRLLVGQPVLRVLDLLALLVEGLLEDAVLVLDAVAECRHAQRGQRVDEAGGQTAQATVAERGLVLGIDDVLVIEAELLDGLVELLGQAGVEQRVAQLLAHQELGAQVTDGLGVAVDHVLLRLHPGIHEMTAHCGGGGDVHVGRRGLLNGHALRVLELLADLIRELRSRDGGLRCGNFSHYLTPSDG